MLNHSSPRLRWRRTRSLLRRRPNSTCLAWLRLRASHWLLNDRPVAKVTNAIKSWRLLLMVRCPRLGSLSLNNFEFIPLIHGLCIGMVLDQQHRRWCLRFASRELIWSGSSGSCISNNIRPVHARLPRAEGLDRIRRLRHRRPRRHDHHHMQVCVC